MEDDVLEEMRQQMAVLNDKLSKENFVSEEFLRKAMCHDYSWIGKYIKTEKICVVFIILYFGLSTLCGDMNWYIFALITVICVAELLFNIRYLKISEQDFETKSLVEIQTKLYSDLPKTLELLLYCLGILAFVLWMVQIYQQDGMVKVVVMSVAGIIGAYFGIRYVLKIKRIKKSVLASLYEWRSNRNID